ncbi:MAG TPA: MFS transporter [Solirubrobacteraceae bacterium]|nr:MFS transporter [Solirubrobacteraceae bacterium]
MPRDEVVQRPDDQDGTIEGALDGEAALGGIEADAVRPGDGMDADIEAPAQRRWLPRTNARVGSRETWILVVCCVAQFMVILDLSIVNVALPSIQSSLNFSSAELLWIINAYTIAFAGFLLLGGRAADQLGQRRVFVAALVLFSITSLVGGASQSKEMLVAARGVQGFSCAFMAASSLAIITSSFPPGPKLHRAVGLWAAMNGAGGAAGVLFGGIITQELSWRWVLLINPPIGIAAALVGWRVVADIRRRREGSFDLAGALTLTIGQMVLVYGVVEAGLRSWHAALAIGPILGGFALLMLFTVIETRVASDPLIPFKEFTRPLRTANGIVLLFSGALFVMWYLSTLYLQQVLGLSPLHAGLAFLPMALMIMLVARSAGKLVSRFGVRTVLFSGLLMMTAGLLLFTKIAASGSAIVYVVVPGLLTSAGIALSIVPSTILATSGVKQGQAGLASGLVNTSRQIGAGLGIAVIITLATTISSHLIGNGQAVPEALTNGFRVGYYIGAGLTALAAVATLVFVPRSGPAPAGPLLRRSMLGIGVAAAIVGFVALDFGVGGSHGAPLGAYTTNGAYSYVSAPGLHPPIIKADVTPVHTSELAPGYIFVGNFYNTTYPPMIGQSGPLILDNRLQPVWFKPVPQKDVASNLSLETYQGKPALSWWQGTITNTGETLTGEDVVVNQHYQHVATIKGKDGWVPTVHEIIIHGNDAWVSVNKNLPMDLSKYGGAYNGSMIDAGVQEYNIKTGKLLYTWDALKHISLNDSQATLPTNGFPWDAYHVNSIQLIGNGQMLVSMRDTWAVYLVNIRTGHIVWTLGGRHSSFKFAPGAAFAWQHDVRAYSGSDLMTMFDDHCCQETGGGTYVSPSAPSRGLVLKVNTATRTATAVSTYSHGSSFDSQFMGSLEPLPGGDEFVGWGSQQNFTEYTGSGHMILDGYLPYPDISYRTTVEPWVGLPLYPPSGAARHKAGKTVVYASWNGATRVLSWRVLGGSSSSQLSPVASASRKGFETQIVVPSSDTTFKLEAIGAGNRVIGTSHSFQVTR